MGPAVERGCDQWAGPGPERGGDVDQGQSWLGEGPQAYQGGGKSGAGQAGGRGCGRLAAGQLGGSLAEVGVIVTGYSGR